MTEGQTQIEVPPEPTSGPCGWCGTQTRMRIVLEKSWTTAANGSRVPKKTKWSWVCLACNQTLVRREGAKT